MLNNFMQCADMIMIIAKLNGGELWKFSEEDGIHVNF